MFRDYYELLDGGYDVQIHSRDSQLCSEPVDDDNFNLPNCIYAFHACNDAFSIQTDDCWGVKIISLLNASRCNASPVTDLNLLTGHRCFLACSGYSPSIWEQPKTTHLMTTSMLIEQQMQSLSHRPHNSEQSTCSIHRTSIPRPIPQPHASNPSNVAPTPQPPPTVRTSFKAQTKETIDGISQRQNFLHPKFLSGAGNGVPTHGPQATTIPDSSPREERREIGASDKGQASASRIVAEPSFIK